MGFLETGTYRAIVRLTAPAAPTEVVLAPMVFLATAAMGGCAVARIRRGATTLVALLVMLTVAVSIALNHCTIPVPWWYQCGFLVTGPLAVVVTPALLRVGRGAAREPAT